MRKLIAITAALSLWATMIPTSVFAQSIGYPKKGFSGATAGKQKPYAGASAGASAGRKTFSGATATGEPRKPFGGANAQSPTGQPLAADRAK